ncbi:MAG: glycosyltransferase family 2 protein [Vallitalea sp.]|jgi:glycosyltransferase involved in cell wall biosynthesis|nr:glycosyltransferase family 2 protein [Vallitalea sp.]
MKNATHVTIITSAYNVEKYIEKCITSVLNQTFRDFEWIILDNGSTDKTGVILKKYAVLDDRIVLFQNKKNNRIQNCKDIQLLTYKDLVWEAKGRYITELDSDDYLREDFLKKMVEAAIENDADIIASGTTMFMDNEPNKTISRIPPAIVTNDISKIWNNLEEYYGSFRPTWGKLFERQFYLRNLEYFFNRPSYMINGGDTLLCLRALRKAKSLVCLNESLHFYRIRQSSGYHSNLFVERYKSYDFLYNESYSLLQEEGKLTDENHSFIRTVHYYSMIDCLRIVLNAANSNYQTRLKFLQGIVTSKVLMSYFRLLDIDSANYFKDLLNQVLKNIYDSQDTYSQLELYNFFLYRQFMANEMQKNSNSNDCALLYFSSLFDRENKYQWGGEECNKYFKIIIPQWFIKLSNTYQFNVDIILEDVNLFCSIVNNDIENANSVCQDICKNNKKNDFIILHKALKNSKYNRDNTVISQVKDEITHALQNNNIEAAFDSLLKINSEIIFDRDILYFRSFISWVIDDKDVAIYLLFSALTLYYQDNDLLELVSKVLEKQK